MISKDKIKEWVDIYLEHIEEITPETHVRDEEGYKFISVDTFQQHFNIDAPDLAENLDEAIENNNLVVGNMYFPKRVLLALSNEYEEDVRQALIILFDTKKDVARRINKTEKVFEDILEKWNSYHKEEERMDHTFIGLRFLSLLLGCRYPDEYNAIKPREWNMFCKFIDEDFRIPQGTPSGERYMMLEPCIETLRTYIKEIPEIQKLRDQLTRGLEFRDEEFRWMAQDVIYVTSRVLAGRRSTEEITKETTVVQAESNGTVGGGASETANMEFPLEDYLENFIVRNWDSIDFGEKLTLYEDQDGPAQQYPTGEGYIDILAKDEKDNFVVIELKKGRSNQQVVGQILGYVGWVKKNLAEKDEKVRGIIVAADGNRALLDAVSMVQEFVSVKYYRVKFNFEDPEQAD